MTIEQKINKEKIKMFALNAAFFLFIVFVLCFFLKETVFSLTENQKIDWYRNNAGLLENNSIFKNAIRSIGWAITRLIIYIGSGAEKIFDIAFGFVDFTQGKAVSGFIERFKPVLLALMALSLLWLGIMLIVKHEKKPDFATNVVIFFFVVMCSGVVFSMLNSALLSFKDGVLGSKTQVVYEVADGNILDLVNADKKGKIRGLNYSKDSGKGYYGKVITGKNAKEKQTAFDLIDFNEVLNYKSSKYGYSADFKELLSKKVTSIGGKLYLDDIDNGFGFNSGDDDDIGNEFYYRYKFNFIIGWIQLASLILVYLAMSYKTIRVIFELVIAKVLAYLYSTEISGGEKVKRIGIFIRDCYILLCVDVICIKVYSLFTAYISGVSGIPTLAAALFSLFVAFAVIDGPNLVEKILGMDAGLKSSTGRILAIGAGVKAATSGVLGFPAKAIRKGQGIRHGDVDRGGFVGGLKGFYHGLDRGRDVASRGGIKGIRKARADKKEEARAEKESFGNDKTQSYSKTESGGSGGSGFDKKQKESKGTFKKDSGLNKNSGKTSGKDVDPQKRDPIKEFGENLNENKGVAGGNETANRFDKAMKESPRESFSKGTKTTSSKDFEKFKEERTIKKKGDRK